MKKKTRGQDGFFRFNLRTHLVGIEQKDRFLFFKFWFDFHEQPTFF